MARGEYIAFPMIVENVVLGLITTTLDVVERFNIPDAIISLELPSVDRVRKAHERKVYTDSNAADTTVTTNVDRVVKAYVPDKTRINSGKKIKLDTGLRSVPPSASTAERTSTRPGSARLATFNFPHGVSNYQVARWITVNIPAARRPKYFITPAGVRRRTNVAAAPGQTTGEPET